MGNEIIGIVIFVLIAIVCTAMVRLFTRKRIHVMVGSALLIILSVVALELVFTGKLETISLAFLVVALLTSVATGFIVTIYTSNSVKHKH
jgi:hypothetical protein